MKLVNEKFSDVSDVEPAPTTSKDMFNFSLETNTLQTVLERLRKQLESNSARMAEFETSLKLRTTDRALSLHFERASSAVPKEVGEKSSKFRLNDQNFLNEDFESQD